MQIDITSRHANLNDNVRDHINRQFEKVERLVSPFATIHVELRREQNPANSDPEVAEATLHLTGTVLKASAESPDMLHSIDELSEKLARQVKRYHEKRRGPRH